MPEHFLPVAPAADVLMRRMLNLMAHLKTVCAEDAAELVRLGAKRQTDIAGAERAARGGTERAIDATYGLSNPKSLGGRLRAELGAIGDIQHQDPGGPPTSLEHALAEWSRIAPSAERRVNEFRGAHDAWQQRFIKRTKSAPRVEERLWRDLDRLDLIHRSLPALKQSVIATEIQAATGAADVVFEAEVQRLAAGESHLASELKATLDAVERDLALSAVRWSDNRWNAPTPADAVERLIRLGDLVSELPPSLGVEGIPALIAFPLAVGVAIHSDVDRRGESVALLKSLMLRLLASVPPAALQLKVIDPVSLGQSVAEFRHLAEYDDLLMDEKTWTSERDVERLMDRMTAHIEAVISQYLKGQFESITDYNQHAGEVAQPYRVLVIFDYPNGFTERASRQLLSLIENGPRCGVYTLLHCDVAATGASSSLASSPDRLTRDMHRVTFDPAGALLDLPDPIGQVSLRLLPDQAPLIKFDDDGQPETGCARLLAVIGSTTKAGHERPTTVTLDTLLPVLDRSRAGVLPDFGPGAPALSTKPSTWWAASTARTAVAPIGRSGAHQVASLYFSSTDIAGGAIVVGLPRSGKTTSLHALIMTLALLYSPEELELYLIDAKHGVEFKVYDTLPHARMVSIHSDREYSVAILKALDQEIRRRAELMKADGSGRANITEYRNATGERLPRIVAVIDEFQEIFEEPDRIGQEAFAFFSNIVRMGPFSGVHLVVASQTLSSMPAMDRPTLMLLPQRIAFTCTEYDAEIVMGSTNRAPLRLSKTGEGVFNPARGEESRNQLFQGLYIAPERRKELVSTLDTKALEIGYQTRPRVFDGDAVVSRPSLNEPYDSTSRLFKIPVGEPFSLDPNASIILRRSRGSNILLTGSEAGTNDRTLSGVLHSCLLAAHWASIPVALIDFAGDDEDSSAPLLDVAEALGARYVRSRGAGSVLSAAAEAVARRSEAADYKAPTQVLVVVGFERALSLKPIDPYADDQGESSDAALLLTVLQGGPEVGIHTVLHADRTRAVEARLGPEALPELSLRMASSVTDQIDLPAVAGYSATVTPLRPGQLLIGDHAKGDVRRIRGYSFITPAQLASQLKGGGARS